MKELIEHARREGELPGGTYRVSALIDGRLWTRDFDQLAPAAAYADDVVSEADAEHAQAVVVDESFHVVHTGRPYFLP